MSHACCPDAAISWERVFAWVEKLHLTSCLYFTSSRTRARQMVHSDLVKVLTNDRPYRTWSLASARKTGWLDCRLGPLVLSPPKPSLRKMVFEAARVARLCGTRQAGAKATSILAQSPATLAVLRLSRPMFSDSFLYTSARHSAISAFGSRHCTVKALRMRRTGLLHRVPPLSTTIMRAVRGM